MSELDLVATRVAYGEMLPEMGELFPNLVVLDADISKAMQTGAFRKRFPERSVNFGIAEQDMMAAAAGMATMGKIPVVNTYAVFAAMRACEQLRTFIAYPNLNVKVVVSHGGLGVGWDGVTHQGLEDMSIVRSIPNMTIVHPADAVSTRKLLPQVIAHEGPVYLRLGRNPTPVIYPEDREITMGRAEILTEGSDVAIIACGLMVCESLKAIEMLRAEGVHARLVDMHAVKPLDEAAVVESARLCGAVVAAEDNNILGGLGSAVAETLGEHYPVPITRIGVPDRFGESGDPDALFEKYGMSAKHIGAAARRLVESKGGRMKRSR